MTAEESAQDVARRIREDAERRARRTAGPGAGTSAGDRSAAVLASLPPSWSTLPQRRRRDAPDPLARHLTVGPGGVFAITSLVAGGEAVSPVEAVPAARAWGDAVRATAGPFATHVVAVLCLPPTVSGPDPGDGRCLVCDSGTLQGVLTGAPAVLSPAEVAAAAIRLEAVRQTGNAHPDRPTRPLPWPPGVWGVAARVLVGLLLVLVLVVLALVGTRISGGLGGGL